MQRFFVCKAYFAHYTTAIIGHFLGDIWCYTLELLRSGGRGCETLRDHDEDGHILPRSLYSIEQATCTRGIANSLQGHQRSSSVILQDLVKHLVHL